MFSFLMKTSKLMGSNNAWPILFHTNTLLPPVLKKLHCSCSEVCVHPKSTGPVAGHLATCSVGLGPVCGAEDHGRCIARQCRGRMSEAGLPDLPYC